MKVLTPVCVRTITSAEEFVVFARREYNYEVQIVDHKEGKGRLE